MLKIVLWIDKTLVKGFMYLKNKEALILKGFFNLFCLMSLSVPWGIYQNCIDIFDGP